MGFLTDLYFADKYKVTQNLEIQKRSTLVIKVVKTQKQNKRMNEAIHSPKSHLAGNHF